jgi:hypothetical protein
VRAQRQPSKISTLEATRTHVQVSINVFSESRHKLAAAHVLSLYEPSGLARAATIDDADEAVEAVAIELRAAADAVCEVSGVGIDGGTLLHRLIESRYDPLHGSGRGGDGGSRVGRGSRRSSEGGDGGDVGGGGASKVADAPASGEIDYSQFLLPEFRDSSSPQAQQASPLEAALVDLQHSSPLFDKLFDSSSHPSASPHNRGVLEITLCHLLELWAVRTVGADGVEDALRSAADTSTSL